MAVEQTKTTIDDDSSSNSDLVRKIVAAVVGLIVIIAIVFLAKWLGDLIRTRFIDNKTPKVETTTTPSTNATDSGTVSTISAIPATGPNDSAYLMLGLMAVTGISVLTLSKKFSFS